MIKDINDGSSHGMVSDDRDLSFGTIYSPIDIISQIDRGTENSEETSNGKKINENIFLFNKDNVFEICQKLDSWTLQRKTIAEKYPYAVIISSLGKKGKRGEGRVKIPVKDADLLKLIPKSIFWEKHAYLFDERGLPITRVHGEGSSSVLVCFKQDTDVEKVNELIHSAITKNKLPYRTQVFYGNPFDPSLETVVIAHDEDPEFDPSQFGTVKHSVKEGRKRFIVFKKMNNFLPAMEKLQKRTNKVQRGWFHASPFEAQGSPSFKFMKRASNFPVIPEQLVEGIAHNLGIKLDPISASPPVPETHKVQQSGDSKAEVEQCKPPNSTEGEKVELVINERAEASNEGTNSKSVPQKQKVSPPKTNKEVSRQQKPSVKNAPTPEKSSTIPQPKSETRSILDNVPDDSPKVKETFPPCLQKFASNSIVSIKVVCYFYQCPRKQLDDTRDTFTSSIESLVGDELEVEYKQYDNVVEMHVTEQVDRLRSLCEILRQYRHEKHPSWGPNNFAVVLQV
jgi:hypothetical protein